MRRTREAEPQQIDFSVPILDENLYTKIFNDVVSDEVADIVEVDEPEEDTTVDTEEPLAEFAQEQLIVNNFLNIDDPIGLYLWQMAQEPLLTADEEVSLAKRIEAGNSEWASEADKEDAQLAREHFARANTKLVVSIAKKYLDRGVAFLDLIQEGNWGLMIAVDRYDYKLGNRFSTYATWWIRQKVSRAVQNQSRTVRIPIHIQGRLIKVYEFLRIYNAEHGVKPDLKLVAMELEMSPKEVADLLTQAQQVRSLDESTAHVRGSEDGRTLQDTIEDTTFESPESSARDNEMKQRLYEVLGQLTERQRKVVTLRYGLAGEQSHTLEQISQIEGVTRERIRQILERVIKVLRHPRMKSQLIKPE